MEATKRIAIESPPVCESLILSVSPPGIVPVLFNRISISSTFFDKLGNTFTLA